MLSYTLPKYDRKRRVRPGVRRFRRGTFRPRPRPCATAKLWVPRVRVRRAGTGPRPRRASSWRLASLATVSTTVVGYF